LCISALLFAGCGEETDATPPDGPGETTTEGGTSGGTGSEGPPAASITLELPDASVAGAKGELTGVAGTEVSLAIKVKHVDLVDPAENTTHVDGEGHIAIYVSSPIPKNKVYAGVGATQEDDDSAIILQFAIPYETPPGLTKIYARILNNDGTYNNANSSQDTFPLLVEAGVEAVTLAFNTPTEGSVVSPGSTLSLSLDVSGLTWIAPGSKSENVHGEGYVLIHLDDSADDAPALTLTEPTADLILDGALPTGKHILRASVRQNDGSLFIVHGEDSTPGSGDCTENPEQCVPIESVVAFYIPSETNPTIAFDAPSAGNVIHPGAPVTVSVSVHDFLLVPPGEGLSSTAGQALIFLDDGTEPIGSGGANTFDVTIPSDATSGSHELTARLVQDDGTPTSAEATVTVNIPTVTIVEPESNALLGKGGEFDVTIALQGFTLVALDSESPNALGEGHYQLFLDEEETAFFAGDKIAATAIVPETASTGFHNLRLSLRNNDGTAVGVDSTVTIAVGEGIPTVKIQTPQPNKTVQAGGTLVVSLKVTNIALTPKEENAVELFGQGYYQIHLDQQNEANLVAEGSANPAFITLPADLTPGVHKITASLYSNSGTPLDIDDDVLITAVPLSAAVITALHPAGGTAYAAGSRIGLQVETAGITLVAPVDGATNVGGEGHYQVFIDSASDPAVVSADPEAALDLPLDIEVGNHSLTLAIANNNGTLVNGSTDTVPFTVWSSPSVVINAPEEDSAYALGDEIALEVEVTGMTLSDPASTPANASGEGHYSVFIGEQEEAIATGSSAAITIPVVTGMPGGIQDLRVSLRNNDGSEIVGADATQSIQVDAPIITFLSPSDTICYGQDDDIVVNIDIANFTLVPQSVGLANQDGEGHYFVYLDGAEGAEIIYTGAENTFTLELADPLSVGWHELRLVLVANNNTALGIEETVSFLVSTAGIVITAPTSGSTVSVGGTLDIEFTLTNFQLDLDNEFGATNVPGTGHVRIYLDDATGEDYIVDAINTHAEIDLPADLSEGDHWIHLVLTENDGTPLVPSATAKVSVTVE
jgi:hypothetical protein